MSDFSELTDLLQDLQNAPQRIAQRVSGRMTRAQRELLGVARSVVHVKTGTLRDGLTVQPVYVAADGLEFTVAAPSVPYADLEVARGGPHDFVAQTLEVGAGIIDQAAEDVAEIAANALLGQG